MTMLVSSGFRIVRKLGGPVGVHSTRVEEFMVEYKSQISHLLIDARRIFRAIQCEADIYESYLPSNFSRSVIILRCHTTLSRRT